MSTQTIGRRHAWLVGLGWYILAYIPFTLMLLAGVFSRSTADQIRVVALIFFLGAAANAIYQGIKFWQRFGRPSS